ncbi:5-oxoprolinase subunit PxpA [Pseudoneobacillus rhizosphaerae]|uniref:5-oxoprolinase subunit A n=1 Tax=Pseudoneobacillus rhizosphaerae TaxID=2880968 RepID=A0A9C7GD68_9BACI|nr:5-oxoprolinase subunit PxpA [Pseudoneobacillus rhizosphaerae]CAG9610194.1 5-oxoprolinase subunit A [Pseudoneobacillus rhizosphaerae]
MLSVDLNCDLGESFGVYRVGNDKEIMKFVSSVNIACGFHAGDPTIMNQTVELACQNDVKIGAHPGYLDLTGFGRRNINLTPDEVYANVLYQIGALNAFVIAHGTSLHHVKPHGALYNMSAVNPHLAEAVAKAVYDFDPSLTLYGLANSELIKAGEKYSLKTAQEVFADRTYQADGTLTPRTESNALITDERQSINQTLQMVLDNQITCITGETIPIVADTICLHGDGEHALSFAQKIRTAFEKEGISIK